MKSNVISWLQASILKSHQKEYHDRNARIMIGMCTNCLLMHISHYRPYHRLLSKGQKISSNHPKGSPGIGHLPELDSSCKIQSASTTILDIK